MTNKIQILLNTLKCRRNLHGITYVIIFLAKYSNNIRNILKLLSVVD